ncbi:unnamed protein product [Sphenostylis stenocarpa]|uniref:Pectinesterase n=1 Tax=Sphenostylis stenocarpa TaxID=92480 RepID=A0AA86TBY4_9FABA|nr:unnamed protein product [Sphenostylis stenocarpa]
MAISKLSLSLFMVYFLSIFCKYASLASSSFSTDTICNLTPYPSFCKSISPKGQGDIHEYGRFFVGKSVSFSQSFFTFISKYLNSNSTILALQDCYLLADLSQSFLSKTLKSINSAYTLGTSEAEKLHTLLSATLTNHDTCLNSLHETTSKPDHDLLTHLSYGTKLYSISLAIFKRGWRANKKTERELETNYHIVWEQKLHELTRIRGRKLLQLGAENVLVSQSVVVNPDGSGDYTKINDAVAAAPNNTDLSNGFFVIHVVGGVYEEYVSIPQYKQYLMMIGDGINQTIITGNRSVADGWSTFSSATFAVFGQGFVAMNITFRNTAGAIKYQAVALRSGADSSAFYKCSFEGYQDTLYTQSLRQFYRNCDIYGTVDFIFGNAAVVLQNCNIYLRLPMRNQFNAITAQGRADSNQNTGISIHKCKITAASDLANSSTTTKTYLGRPWRLYSQTVYMQSFMDSLVDAEGWVAWSGDFALDTLYYAEFDNYGPGSDTSNRVTWPGYHVINATDAVNFTVANFILGGLWLPATGIPYSSGLL